MRPTSALSRRRFAVPAVALAAAVSLGLATVPASAKTTTTTVPPTTLPIGTLPPTTGTGAASAGTGKILMVKLYVGDLAAAEKFYGTVFGATPLMSVGANAHIVSLPGGGPGLVLLKTAKKDRGKYGAFIIQVPNMDAARDAAVANGAKVQGTFAGKPSGNVARSVDVLDPWGNQVEILQIG